MHERAGRARGWHIGLQGESVIRHIEPSPSLIDFIRELGMEDAAHSRQLVGEAFVFDAIQTLTTRQVAIGTRNGTLPPAAGALANLMAARTDARRSALLSELTGPSGVAVSPGAGGPYWGMVRVMTHRIGGGTAETQCNAVAERYLGLPRVTGSDRDLAFNQLKHSAVQKART